VPSLVFNFSVIFSIFCIIAGGLLWIIGMSKYELSFMYPFLTLNYLLIILGSVFLLHEKVSIFTYLAIFFIVTGLVIISRSKYAEKN
jgi:drug/metabolite transporter (DMT)-like permease